MKTSLWLACGFVLISAGCLTRTPIGSAAADAGADADVDAAVDPLTELREGMRGRFCGYSTSDPEQVAVRQELEIEFGPSEYTVHCDCRQPFGREPTPDGVTGRYLVTELTLNAEGWGRAEDPLGAGFVSEVELQRIRLDGDTLTMRRVTGDGLRTTFLELRRCDDADDG